MSVCVSLCVHIYIHIYVYICIWQYEKAIPLPFFDAPDAQQHNVTALLDGHRPISPAGEHMLHTLKVNLAAPNVFLYGNGASSTPKSDRYRTAYGEYGFFDGLEDQETNSTVARQHKPLSFWFEHPTAGSKALAERGKVNVNGESTWDDVLTHVPVFASNWSHPVATDLSRPPEYSDRAQPVLRAAHKSLKGARG